MGMNLPLLFLMAATGAAPGRPPLSSVPLQRLGPGNHTIHLRHAERNRTYHVHVPRQATRPAPVVLAFHGGGGHGLQFKRSAGLDAVSEREGFIAVYPDGTGPRRDRLLTWNAGGCCGYAAEHRVDDVGFVRALVDDLAKRIDIDRTRIHATGHSNGGMMSYRLAVDASDLVASIVPVGGSMVTEFHPTRPIPVLHIHSVDDPRALYQGGEGPPFPGTNHRSLHQSVERTLGTWIGFNGCHEVPRTLRTLVGEQNTRGAGHTAELLEWGPCSSGTVVRHWKLTGPGHGWPGATGRSRARIIGPPTDIINAAEEAWHFMAETSAPARGRTPSRG